MNKNSFMVIFALFFKRLKDSYENICISKMMLFGPRSVFGCSTSSGHWKTIVVVNQNIVENITYSSQSDELS